MIEAYGCDRNFMSQSISLSEVSLACSKKDLILLRNFLDKCVEEMHKGKFTGENGGHRHYQDFIQEGHLKDESDFIISLKHRKKKNVR